MYQMVTKTYLPSYLCDSSDVSDRSDSSDSSDSSNSGDSSDHKTLFTKTIFHKKTFLPNNLFTKKPVHQKKVLTTIVFQFFIFFF